MIRSQATPITAPPSAAWCEPSTRRRRRRGRSRGSSPRSRRAARRSSRPRAMRSCRGAAPGSAPARRAARTAQHAIATWAMRAQRRPAPFVPGERPFHTQSEGGAAAAEAEAPAGPGTRDRASSACIASAHSASSCRQRREATTRGCAPGDRRAARRSRADVAPATTDTSRMMTSSASARTKRPPMTHLPARSAALRRQRSGRRHVLARVLEARRGQPVQVTARPAGRRLGLPARLEQIALREPHEDRVQRSRGEPDLDAELVAVAPAGRIIREGPEHARGLRRGASRAAHAISLPI